MEKHSYTLDYTSYENESELNDMDAALMKSAKEAANRAYAPYSKFSVGCAILLENKQLITGNNQENAAYPSGTCAERVAMFYASSQYPGVKVIKIAVTAFSKEHPVLSPVSPCGSCRQVLSEYEKLYVSDIEILLQGQEGRIYRLKSVSMLLPLAFGAESLL